jgi:hypothetical protein
LASCKYAETKIKKLSENFSENKRSDIHTNKINLEEVVTCKFHMKDKGKKEGTKFSHNLRTTELDYISYQ